MFLKKSFRFSSIKNIKFREENFFCNFVLATIYNSAFYPPDQNDGFYFLDVYP